MTTLLSRIAIVLWFTFEAVHSQAGESLLCLGNSFITRLITVVLDRNRDSIRINEPNRLGNATQNIGLFVLKDARAYNLWRVQIHQDVQVDCQKKTGFALIKFPAQIPEPVFIFDFIIPGHLAYGKIIVTSDLLGQIATLEVPLDRGPTRRVLVTDLEFYRSDDFKITFTGLGPLTRALSSVLWATYRIVPQIPLQLYRALAIRSVQNYIDLNPLPL